MYKWIHRANCFGDFICDNYIQQNATFGDRPYSLFEGWGGTVAFMHDLLCIDEIYNNMHRPANPNDLQQSSTKPKIPDTGFPFYELVQPFEL